VGTDPPLFVIDTQKKKKKKKAETVRPSAPGKRGRETPGECIREGLGPGGGKIKPVGGDKKITESMRVQRNRVRGENRVALR